MTCTRCGARLAPGGRFCGACGQAAQESSPTPGFVDIVTDDWQAATRIAATTLGVSLLLALIFGVASRPALGHLQWTVKATVAWVAWVWESIFGVNMVGHSHATGSLSIAGIGANGDVLASANLGAMPLTLTLITMAIAVAAFRRATAQHSSAASTLLLGVKAALLTALPLLIVSLFISLSDTDLISLLNTKPGSNGNLASTVSQWQALSGEHTLALTLSSTEAFFVSFALVLAVFVGALLLRSTPFANRFWESARRWLVAPARAVGRLSVALVAGGLLFELVTWQVRWRTPWRAASFGGHGKPPHLSVAQWIDSFAAAIAYAGNAGILALGLGSGSTVGLSTSGNASMSGFSVSQGSPADRAQHGIGWWAGSDHLAAGIWIAALITPAVLAYVAWSIARVHRHELRTTTRVLAAWVASLVVLIPLLGLLANLSASGSANVNGNVFGVLSGSATADGSAGFGLALALSTATLVAYAAIVAAVIAAIQRARNSGVGTDPPSSPQ